MIGLLFVAFCQAALPPEPASPPPPAPAPATQQDAIDVNAEKQVRCRVTRVTGSMFGVRRCTTVRQEAEAREDSRRELMRLQDEVLKQIPRTDPQ